MATGRIRRTLIAATISQQERQTATNVQRTSNRLKHQSFHQPEHRPSGQSHKCNSVVHELCLESLWKDCAGGVTYTFWGAVSPARKKWSADVLVSFDCTDFSLLFSCTSKDACTFVARAALLSWRCPPPAPERTSRSKTISDLCKSTRQSLRDRLLLFFHRPQDMFHRKC